MGFPKEGYNLTSHPTPFSHNAVLTSLPLRSGSYVLGSLNLISIPNTVPKLAHVEGSHGDTTCT